MLCTTATSLGLSQISNEYVTLLNYALHERLRTMLEQLVLLSRQRVDMRKGDFATIPSVGIRQILRSIEKTDREAALKRQQEIDRIKAAQDIKVSKKDKKDKAKAKANQEQEEQNTNVTALHAVGDVRIRSSAQLSSSTQGTGNTPSWLNPSTSRSTAQATNGGTAAASTTNATASSSSSSLSSSTSGTATTSATAKSFVCVVSNHWLTRLLADLNCVSVSVYVCVCVCV
jgi:hypothetical protein